MPGGENKSKKETKEHEEHEKEEEKKKEGDAQGKKPDRHQSARLREAAKVRHTKMRDVISPHGKRQIKRLI